MKVSIFIWIGTILIIMLVIIIYILRRKKEYFFNNTDSPTIIPGNYYIKNITYNNYMIYNSSENMLTWSEFPEADGIFQIDASLNILMTTGNYLHAQCQSQLQSIGNISDDEKNHLYLDIKSSKIMISEIGMGIDLSSNGLYYCNTTSSITPDNTFDIHPAYLYKSGMCAVYMNNIGLLVSTNMCSDTYKHVDCLYNDIDPKGVRCKLESIQRPGHFLSSTIYPPNPHYQTNLIEDICGEHFYIDKNGYITVENGHFKLVPNNNLIVMSSLTDDFNGLQLELNAQGFLVFTHPIAVCAQNIFNVGLIASQTTCDSTYKIQQTGNKISLVSDHDYGDGQQWVVCYTDASNAPSPLYETPSTQCPNQNSLFTLQDSNILINNKKFYPNGNHINLVPLNLEYPNNFQLQLSSDNHLIFSPRETPICAQSFDFGLLPDVSTCLTTYSVKECSANGCILTSDQDTTKTLCYNNQADLPSILFDSSFCNTKFTFESKFLTIEGNRFKAVGDSIGIANRDSLDPQLYITNITNGTLEFKEVPTCSDNKTNIGLVPQNQNCISTYNLQQCDQNNNCILASNMNPGQVLCVNSTATDTGTISAISEADQQTCQNKFFNVNRGVVSWNNNVFIPGTDKLLMVNSKFYVIVDVKIILLTNGTTNVPIPINMSEYTGIRWNIPTLPYIPGIIGTQMTMDTTTKGIGGDDYGIVVKYAQLDITDSIPVYTDLVVSKWGNVYDNWNVDCPDGYFPIGSLNYGTQSIFSHPCYEMGLCGLTKPMNKTDSFIGALCWSWNPNGPPQSFNANVNNQQINITAPTNAMDVHSGCGDPNSLYLCIGFNTTNVPNLSKLDYRLNIKFDKQYSKRMGSMILAQPTPQNLKCIVYVNATDSNFIHQVIDSSYSFVITHLHIIVNWNLPKTTNLTNNIPNLLNQIKDQVDEFEKNCMNDLTIWKQNVNQNVKLILCIEPSGGYYGYRTIPDEDGELQPDSPSNPINKSPTYDCDPNKQIHYILANNLFQEYFIGKYDGMDILDRNYYCASNVPDCSGCCPPSGSYTDYNMIQFMHDIKYQAKQSNVNFTLSKVLEHDLTLNKDIRVCNISMGQPGITTYDNLSLIDYGIDFNGNNKYQYPTLSDDQYILGIDFSDTSICSNYTDIINHIVYRRLGGIALYSIWSLYSTINCGINDILQAWNNSICDEHGYLPYYTEGQCSECITNKDCDISNVCLSGQCYITSNLCQDSSICNNQGTYIYNNDKQICDCSCNNGWIGPRCEYSVPQIIITKPIEDGDDYLVVPDTDHSATPVFKKSGKLLLNVANIGLLPTDPKSQDPNVWITWPRCDDKSDVNLLKQCTMTNDIDRNYIIAYTDSPDALTPLYQEPNQTENPNNLFELKADSNPIGYAPYQLLHNGLGFVLKS